MTSIIYDKLLQRPVRIVVRNESIIHQGILQEYDRNNLVLFNPSHGYKIILRRHIKTIHEIK